MSLETLRAELHRAAQSLRQFGRLTAGRLLGTVPTTHGGYRAIVNLEERGLFMRAELNALTRLLAARLGVADAELLAAFVEEYRHLLAEEQKRWPEVTATEAGLEVHDVEAFARRAREEQWPR